MTQHTHDPHADLDLGALASAWQAQDAPPAAQIAARLRAAVWRTRLALLLDASVAGAGLIAGAVLMGQGRVLVGAAALIFSLFALLAVLWARRGRVSADTGTVRAALDTAVEDARRTLRRAQAALWICAAALVFLAAVLMLAAPEAAAAPDLRRTIWAGAGGAVFIAAALAWTIAAQDRARRRLGRLLRLRRSDLALGDQSED